MSIEKYKIKKSHGDIETHHVFLDTMAHTKEAELGISEKKFEVPLSKNLIYLFFVFFVLCAAVLFGKAFYLDVFKGQQLYAQAQNNKGKIDLVSAPRGIIYDSQDNKLVLNAPDFDLVCDKRNLAESSPATTSQINEMASILGVNTSDITTAIGASTQSKVLISQDIPQQTLLVLEAKMGDLANCSIEKNTLRDYVLGPVFSPILGYTGQPSQQDLQNSGSYTVTDSVGKTGLEKSYQQYLQGTPGTSKNITSATGKDSGMQIVTQPVPGDNLVLNINQALQTEMYNALAASIKKIGVQKGAAVAMDPRTGAVLGMVSYPSYDDNLFSGGISAADFNTLINDPNQPLFDRAISSQYPTGSVIKPLMASAALQQNIISPDTLINDPGYIKVPSQYDPSVVYTFGGVEPHGLVDMRKALAVSSNIYFYTVGGGYGSQKGLGPANIKKYLDLFGWEEKTGIDLPGEYSGFVPSPAWKKSVIKEPWTQGDTYNLSIGQSYLQVTPLQVADAYCAIANGGTLYQPQVVNKVISGEPDNNPTVVKQFTPQVTRSGFIDPQNLEVVREGMRDGVDKPYGLETLFQDVPVPVAAKTGTVEIGRPGYYNTWSSAFAPYGAPDFVITVTIEDVHGLGEATLPVANQVLNWYFGLGGPGAKDASSATVTATSGQ